MKEPLQGESMKKGKKKSGVNKDGNNAILSSFVDAAKDDGKLMNPDTFQDKADITAFHQAVKTRDYDKVKHRITFSHALFSPHEFPAFRAAGVFQGEMT